MGELRRKNYLFDSRSRKMKYWELTVMLIACINCFQAPLEIAMRLEIFDSLRYKYLTISIDIFFMTDVLVNFNTTLETSETVYDRRVIALNYFKGRFAIDFLSALPLDFIFFLFVPPNSNQSMKLVSILKLTRLLRLSKMLRAMNVAKDLKGTIKLMKLLFQMVLFLHLIACLHMYLIMEQQLWDHPSYA